MLTFREFVLLREAGLMSIKPPAGGLSRINPFPISSARLNRMRTLSKPSVRPTPLVVPKLKP